MRRLNLTGQRFGRLTVIRDSGKSTNKKKQALHLVRCDCGQELLVETANLRNGNSESCGCSRADHLAAVRPEDMSGEQNPKHKLTSDDVVSIRLMYQTGDWLQRELATEFNVHQTCVGKAIRRETWAHI